MRIIALVAAGMMVATGSLEAQSVANRIAAVRDGKVRMTFASRDDICGFGNGISTKSESRHNTWSRERNADVEYDVDCSEGPARIVIEMDGGQPVQLRAYVGGRWRPASNVTDLGAVGVREATTWLLNVAGNGSRKVASSAIFATTLADSVDVAKSLYQFARNESRPQDARESAVFWMSQFDGSPDYLRDLYAGAGNHGLKDKVIFAMSQRRDASAEKWLLDLVADKSEPLEMRKKALFWAGQGSASMSKLASMYSSSDEREMKEQMIFAFSQKREPAAFDKLMDIARNDPDRAMRKKAMFWLGQSKDPRVAQMLSDIINR